MMTKEGSTKRVFFPVSRTGVLVLGHDHIKVIERKCISLTKILLYSQAQIRQIVYSNDDQGKVYPIVNIMTTGLGFLCWGMTIKSLK